jgi:hypothetical protein
LVTFAAPVPCAIAVAETNNAVHIHFIPRICPRLC